MTHEIAPNAENRPALGMTIEEHEHALDELAAYLGPSAAAEIKAARAALAHLQQDPSAVDESGRLKPGEPLELLIDVQPLHVMAVWFASQFASPFVKNAADDSYKA